MYLYVDPGHPSRPDVPARLFLHPENARERHYCDGLLQMVKTTNMGRNANGKLHHIAVAVELVPDTEETE